MAVELTTESWKQVVTSIERYFLETSGEKIGNIAAAGLLTFFLGEIAPIVYNQAVFDAQERIQARVAELDIDVNKDEWQYWRKADAKKVRK